MYELLVIKYAQDLVDFDLFYSSVFLRLNTDEKKRFLNDLIDLAFITGIKDDDYEAVVAESQLDRSNPCMTKMNGKIELSDLRNVASPSTAELKDALKLLLTLFKVGYSRKYKIHRKDPPTWWYRDLSKAAVIDDLLTEFHSDLDPKYLKKTRRQDLN
jgi:hypothetical protein